MAFVEKDELIRLYVTEKKPIRQVASEMDVSVGTVFNYMKKYGIDTRPAMSDETRQKISKANKGRLLGIKRGAMPNETRQKISIANKGHYTKPSRFGGHRKQRSDGYVYIYCPSHPLASKDGYVMEHVLVMESQVGHIIPRDYVVHHINGIRNDNRIENLRLLTFREHSALHVVDRHKKGTINYFKVPIVNVETGEVFSSAVEAGKKYDVAPSNISRACKNNMRTVRGCHWAYMRKE